MVTERMDKTRMGKQGAAAQTMSDLWRSTGESSEDYSRVEVSIGTQVLDAMWQVADTFNEETLNGAQWVQKKWLKSWSHKV